MKKLTERFFLGPIIGALLLACGGNGAGGAGGTNVVLVQLALVDLPSVEAGTTTELRASLFPATGEQVTGPSAASANPILDSTDWEFAFNAVASGTYQVRIYLVGNREGQESLLAIYSCPVQVTAEAVKGCSSGELAAGQVSGDNGAADQTFFAASGHEDFNTFDPACAGNVFDCDSDGTTNLEVAAMATGFFYPPPVRIERFSVDPPDLFPGESVELSWDVSRAQSCSIDQGIGAVNSESGTLTRMPGATTTYTLTCEDESTLVSKSRQVGLNVAVTHVALGDRHGCAILEDGRVKCWGRNSQGHLGIPGGSYVGDAPGEMGDNLPAVDLGPGRTALDIECGKAHCCVLADDETVRCWGNNVSGQTGAGLGQGGGSSILDLGNGRTATDVTTGYWHSCALLDDASIKCWGQNDSDQLGHSERNIGDEDGEMGDALQAVPLGAGATAVQVAASGNGTCALMDDASVRCWGGALVESLNTPINSRVAEIDFGLGRTAESIDGGVDHFCALLDNGSVYCWGANTRSSAGSNAPGVVDLGAGAVAIAMTAGRWHSCAILDTGEVKCWGDASLGQLGNGSVQSYSAMPPSSELGHNRSAIAIAAGKHTCAILDHRRPKCWGLNVDGQLGLEHSRTTGDEPGEMGDELPTVQLGSP